jgi:hypothetical protein
MTETIEQFAARVCAKHYPPGAILRADLHALLVAELPAFLAQHRQIVEVTAEDVTAVESKYAPYNTPARASEYTARLRARAVPASRPALDVAPIVGHDGGTWPATSDGMAWAIAFNRKFQSVSVDDALGWFCNAIMGERDRHATDTGWIPVPTTQTAGELVVPEDGTYWCEYQHGWSQFDRGVMRAMKTGENAKHFVERIRRIDTDAPTTWITRTPTTTRAWTAESVKACVGRHVVVIDSDGGFDTYGNQYGADAAVWAAAFNRQGVTAFYLFPEDGPR